MRRINLLVTCAGGDTIPSLLNYITDSRSYRYRIIGVDSRELKASSPNLSSFYKVPFGDDPYYLDHMLEISESEKIDFILPGSDEEALALSKSFESFKKIGAHPFVSDWAALNLIANKYDTYNCLKNNGIRVPEYSVANDNDELIVELQRYGFPEKTVISKPAKGRGGRGLVVYQGGDSPPEWLGSGKREIRVSESELIAQLDSAPINEMTLVMPALFAPAYDADVIAVQGKEPIAIVRERINPAGIPFEGNVIHSDEQLTEYCSSVARTLNLNALHDIDLMTNAAGQVCVLEVNPRPSGSLAASLAAGIPVIDLLVQSYLGDDQVYFERSESPVNVICDGGKIFPVEG